MLRKDGFTERFGAAPRPAEMELDVVPTEVRTGLVAIVNNIAANASTLSHGRYNESMLPRTVYQHLFTRPSVQRGYRYSDVTSEFPFEIYDELDRILAECPWNVFFDIVWAVSEVISETLPSARDDFEYNVNELFLEHGLQWVLVGNEIQRRRPEPVAEIIEKGLEVLHAEGFEEPRAQLTKALRALDERLVPDVENSVKDAVGALEGTGRTLVKDPNASLQKILTAEPFRSAVHSTLRDALLKVESYRGDASGAGHAMVAGKPKIEASDAEFVLTTCVAGILLLVEKAKRVS